MEQEDGFSAKLKAWLVGKKLSGIFRKGQAAKILLLAAENLDIRRYDMQHEELLICHPKQWAEEIIDCCGTVS